LRVKGILAILAIGTIVGIGIVSSINQQPPVPGLNDSQETSDEVIVDLNPEKIDTVDASDEVIVDKEISDYENGVKYYYDENGVKHYSVVAEDAVDATG